MSESNPYPAVFHAADNAAVSAQSWFLRLSAFRLTSLVLVAALATVASLLGQWSAILALLPISVAVTSEVILLVRRPERRWYENRSVAESAKTLTWRYQVGGRPIGLRLNQEDADLEVTERLQKILDEFHDLELSPAFQEQVTPQMRNLRSQSLNDRISAYGRNRLDDQRAWYAAKSDWNRRRATQFQVGLIVIELAAFATAIAVAFLGSTLAAYSLLSAMAIAGVGWLQIKRFRSLGNSYAVASHELAGITSTINSIDSEEDWEEFVHRAEEAISREHASWLTSNTHLHRRTKGGG